VIEELFEMFEAYFRLQGLRSAVARSSMQLFSRFRSNAILARKTRKSKLEDCLKVGMKIKTDCSRGI